MATETSDATAKLFGVELVRFFEAHRQFGRGAQQWFAELAGKTRGQISSWARGKIVPGERVWG